MDGTLFRIGGLPITSYGLLVALAALTALLLTLRRKREWAVWVRFAVCVLLGGWLGARLMYVLPDLLMGWLNELGVIAEHNSVYLNAIGSAEPALFFWEGGYSLAGLIPGAILGARIAEGWTHAEKGSLRDLLAPALPAFVLIERLAEHGGNLGVGVEVSAGWLIGLGICPKADGAYFHPLYLYEALLAAAVLIAMSVLSFTRGEKRPGGDLLRLCLVLLCLPMVALEAFRPLTGHMIIHFVNVTQVVMMLLALAVTVRWGARALRRGSVLTVCAGWAAVIAGIGAAVFSIFGMEKDWLSRGLAYALIALSAAVIGAVTLLFRRAGGDPSEP